MRLGGKAGRKPPPEKQVFTNKQIMLLAAEMGQ